MKTSTTKFATVLMLAFGSLFSLAASATEKRDVAAEIKEISVSGNVHVYIADGKEESIRTSGYDENTAQINVENGVLTIASYGEEELTVLVTVTELESIEADSNAFVQTLTDFGISSTDVYLRDGATALLKIGKGDIFLSK